MPTLLAPPPDIANDISRRELIVGGAAAGLLTLAGCGADDPDKPVAPPAEAFPVRITHLFGTTEITQAPERIVALGSADADAAAALGVPPVMITQQFGAPPGTLAPWFAPATGSAEVKVVELGVGEQSGGAGIPFEAVAAERPDVILAMSTRITDQDYKTLIGIAPTVAPQVGNYLDPWQDISVTVGKVLGRGEEAADAVAEVEAGVAAVAKDHPEFAGRTFVVANLFAVDQFGMISVPKENTATLLTRLGFRMSPAVAALTPTSGYATQVSRERAELLEADVALVFLRTDELRRSYESDPLLQQLDVVRRGALIRVDPQLWGAFRNPSVLTIPFAVERLLALLDGVDLGG